MDKIDNLLCITSCDSLQIHEKTLIGQQHYFLCRFTIDLLNNLIYVLYMYKVYLFILQVKKKKNMYLKLRQDPELHVYF